MARFHKMLHACRRQIKPLLLDQKFIAGLGNIYVDEALWKAGIHPLRISCLLSKKEITALHRAIPYVLRTGLRNMGTTLGGWRGQFLLGRRSSGSQRRPAQGVPSRRDGLSALWLRYSTHRGGSAQQPHMSQVSEKTLMTFFITCLKFFVCQRFCG